MYMKRTMNSDQNKLATGTIQSRARGLRLRYISIKECCGMLIKRVHNPTT